MPEVAPIVTIFGGSGFVGRYITQRMARAGWRVRVAVRRPNDALFVRPYGVVGQVEAVQANIRDDVSVRRAIHGARAVVNCVGILVASGRQTFPSVQAEGAGRVARIAAEEGVERLVQLSAVGADAESESDYARTKAEGERAVTDAFPRAVLLRPSIIFGVEDGFFNKFAAMARWSPILPVVGPDTRFQPVFVDDVAQAAAKAVIEGAEPGIYELGGPEVVTFRELLERMLVIIERRRWIVSIPFGLAEVQGSILDGLQRLSFGLFTNSLLTRDQVRLLEEDNVVSPGARGLAELGIAPTPMDAILESYLFTYRQSGQFAKIKASAQGLRQP
jgi:uncharacterized protein YbjT (DUF2867 family)